MTWDRIQRMQLEYQQLEARHRAEVDTLSAQIEELRAIRAVLVESRDLARNVAVRLEQENHAWASETPVCAICSGEVVPVPVIGEAT